MLSALLLLMLGHASAAPPASPSEIVVVGRRAEIALAACLARNCPPGEEVETSLQASAEQFADGRYDDAQHTLQTAIRRNSVHASQLPGPISSLYATLATVAEHQGDSTLWLASARNSVLVLRRYLGEAQSGTMSQELVFADDLIRLEKPGVAAEVYQKVEREAAELGKRELAARAAFRRAWLALLSEHDEEAKRIADEAVTLAGDDDENMLALRDILRARIAIRHGDESEVDTLAAELNRSVGAAPTLLYSPPIENINPPHYGAVRDARPDSNIRFADVGYWIRPDGRTVNAEVLRTSGLGQWLPGILRQVSQRRYASVNVDPGQPGLYRIDRFTIRATRGTPTGSHIAQRMGDLSVHFVSLSDTDAMTEAHRKATGHATSKLDR